MSNNNFIQYYNVFAEENSKYHLSVEELYLYGVLSMMRNVEHLTITNIDVIHQYSPVEFYSRDVESKKRIKNNLLSLKEKGIIQFANDEIKNNSLLVISFDTKLQDDSVGKGVTGFEKVEFVKFNSFTSMIDNYIYFTVKRFNKKGGFNTSYKRWANILNVAEKTAIDKVNEAIEKKVIYCKIGEYTGDKVNGRNQKKQENNIYKTIPFVEELKEVVVPDVGENDIVQDESETRKHNWNDYSSSLDENDLYIYLTTDDDKLKKRAKSRIDAISKNPKGEYMVNKLISGAKELINKEKHERQMDSLKVAKNAVKMKDESIVIVDRNNIDSIDWKQVESAFYGTDKLEHAYGFKSFQPVNIQTHIVEDRPDMIEYGWRLYKEHVKTGEILTHDLMTDMQNKTFKDVYSQGSIGEQSESEDIEIDMMNEYFEQEIRRNKKKDDQDISEFLIL